MRCLSVLVAAGIGACGAPDRDTRAPPLTGIRFLASDTSSAGFSRAIAPRAFVFPQDHGAHPDYRTEWWYFTGNLLTEDGRHFGFELTFFRLALTPAAASRESAWATNQAWVAHFALTDTASARFLAYERISRGALGLAGAVTAPLRVWVRDWSAEGDLNAADATLRLSAQAAEAGIDLELRGFDRVIAQGDRGLDRKGPEPGNASYYYSVPRLAVQGSVRVDQLASAVTGLAWMDREWGTSALSAGIDGWDWFALQLDDGRDLMFYRLRQADGRASPFSGGVLIDTAGEARRLAADDVALDVLETWRSPATAVVYPVAWSLRVPGEDLALRVAPRLRHQEVRLSMRYWEGAVEISGQDGATPIGGVGYLELAGY